MSDQGRLLVTCRAGDGQGAAEQGRVAVARHLGAAGDARQGLDRHIEQVAKVLTPGPRLQVHQGGARGVGGVRDVAFAAPARLGRQLPDQPGIDRTQLDLAPGRSRPAVRHPVQQPGVLGRREIGIEDQARRRLHIRLMPLGHHPRRDVRRPPILPDDGPVQGLARRGVPDHRGLALVGDADGGEPADAPGLSDHLATGLERRGPDLGRVMLDPARAREMLGQLDLADGDGLQRLVVADLESDGPARGRALVDGEDQLGHRSCLG